MKTAEEVESLLIGDVRYKLSEACTVYQYSDLEFKVWAETMVANLIVRTINTFSYTEAKNGNYKTNKGAESLP